MSTPHLGPHIERYPRCLLLQLLLALPPWRLSVAISAGQPAIGLRADALKEMQVLLSAAAVL